MGRKQGEKTNRCLPKPHTRDHLTELKELHKRDDDDKWADKEWLEERHSHRTLRMGVQLSSSSGCKIRVGRDGNHCSVTSFFMLQG